MMCKRTQLLLVTAIATSWVACTLAATAAPPKKKNAPDRPAAASESEQTVGENHGQTTRGSRNPTARQGTPVLGVIIGKPRGVDAAEVLRVWSGSPAEQAGLRMGDQIVKLGDDEIKSPEALRVAVLERDPGDRVQLSVVRDGEPKKIKVRLAGADGPFGWARRGTLPQTTQPSGWLGVAVAPQASSVEAGVIVTRVFPGSPADAAGLEKDDAILQIDKTRVEAASDLKMAVAGREPGETVKLVVRRDGRRKKLDVELGSFARWHGDVSQLTEEEVRQLVHELLATPFSLAEELLPTTDEQPQAMKEEVDLPTIGVAGLIPTEGNDARGTIVLREKDDGLHITGEVTGLKPGLHGFHIHEYGDVRDPHAKAAGGHFNPGDTAHGGPQDEEHHAGDLGNIEANQDGVAQVDIHAPWLKLHYVIGRSIVVHAGEDDLQSQPSGDAGPRVAMGVIGIAQPPQPAKVSKAR